MNKKNIKKVETIQEFMNRFDCSFSMSTKSGFTNIAFEKNYKDEVGMVVKFFNDEGNEISSEEGIPYEEVEKASDFIKGYKEMRLNDYSSEV